MDKLDLQNLIISFDALPERHLPDKQYLNNVVYLLTSAMMEFRLSRMVLDTDGIQQCEFIDVNGVPLTKPAEDVQSLSTILAELRAKGIWRANVQVPSEVVEQVKALLTASSVDVSAFKWDRERPEANGSVRILARPQREHVQIGSQVIELMVTNSLKEFSVVRETDWRISVRAILLSGAPAPDAVLLCKLMLPALAKYKVKGFVAEMPGALVRQARELTRPRFVVSGIKE